MHVLLVVNPQASRTDRRTAAAVADELAAIARVRIVATTRPGDATDAAAEAVESGVTAVCVLGGDGTVNEVVQALVGTEVLLCVAPGGGANVLARTLGTPPGPRVATRMLAGSLVSGHTRTISLGRAGPRWFVVNAGLGFDASVVRHVEQRHMMKRSFGQLAFVWSTAREWFVGGGRREPAVRLSAPDLPDQGPYTMSLVANCAPYTYLGVRELRLHPRASFDRGLDVLLLAPMSTARIIGVLRRTSVDGSHVELPGVTYLHDRTDFTLWSETPQPLMVDGEYLGDHSSVEFSVRPEALRLVVPHGQSTPGPAEPHGR